MIDTLVNELNEERKKSKELLKALHYMLATHPKCSKNIGAPNSLMRLRQENQELAIERAQKAITKYNLQSLSVV